MKYDKKHIAWSKAVRDRADNRCEKCGVKTIKDEKGERPARLNAHHILSKERWPEYRYDLDNGVSLCYRCHRRIAHLDGVEFCLWLAQCLQDKYEWAKKRIEERKI